ncbi:MAG: hypothetical protein M3P95_04825 [Actinomycetota bacterium]|nr:hypothetical protein [Actinomycetota bacterium]
MPARFAASVAVSRPTASRTPAYRDSSRRWNRTEPQTITGIGRNASSVSELAANTPPTSSTLSASVMTAGAPTSRHRSRWFVPSALRAASQETSSFMTPSRPPELVSSNQAASRSCTCS